ncbi:MAG TPA: FAD/NAD(P)-binding protein [Terriglobia bacterium]|nr:FAD/NAD(P)-binding protein [Terriglobia bacterium]
MKSTLERQPEAAVPHPMIPKSFRVQRIKGETEDTFTLDMTSCESRDGVRFSPGQFNMLYVFGVGEVPISISGNPAQPDNLVHTVRAVGAVTQAMERMKKGDVLGARGPFGSHWPVEEAAGRDVLIVAGGIGLAPLRPALYYILSNRGQYNKVVLLYGTRTPEDILYRKELERWRSRLDLSVHVTVDRAKPGWKGNVGVVTTLIPKADINPAAALAFVCGPEIMMKFTLLELERRGLDDAQVYLSMERNMKCAVGFCGHCQYGPAFICKDGPVFRYDRIRSRFELREV